MTETPALWMSLELDPGMASFFGLPDRVLLPAEGEASPLAEEGRRATLPKLAEGLAQAVEAGTEMAGQAGVLRFLHRWPRYQDLDRYLKQGNVTFAEAVAKNILFEDATDPPSLAVLALARAGEGRWEKSLTHLERARQAAPGHAPLQLQLALALAGAGRQEEALELLEALSQRSSLPSMARLWRYEVRCRSSEDLAGRLARSMRTLAVPADAAGRTGEQPGLEEAFPDNPEILYLRALQGGTPPGTEPAEDEREARFRRILELDSGHIPARTALVRQLARRTELREALSLVEEGLQGSPRDAHLLATRGQLLERAERPLEALSAYRAVFEPPLAHVPDVALVIAGQGLLRLDALPAVRSLFDDLAEARPGDPLPHQFLARLEERNGDREAAEHRLREAQRLCGPRPPLVYALGDLLRRSGRRVEAEGLFKVLARRHPDSPWGERGLGDLLVESSPSRALGHYARARELDAGGSIPGYDYLRGVAALRGGDAVQAHGWLQRAVAQEPDNARYWCDLGACSFHQGNLEEAQTATERALRLAPGHPGFLHNLATYLEARFRRNPWKNWSAGGQAWWLRRRARRAASEGWRRDLWLPPEEAEPDSEPARGEPPRDA